MNVPLTPDLELALFTEAGKLGVPPEQLALESLRARFLGASEEVVPTPSQATLAEFLGEYVGVLHSSEFSAAPAQLSVDSGKKFAAALAARHKGKGT